MFAIIGMEWHSKKKKRAWSSMKDILPARQLFDGNFSSSDVAVINRENPQQQSKNWEFLNLVCESLSVDRRARYPFLPPLDRQTEAVEFAEKVSSKSKLRFP